MALGKKTLKEKFNGAAKRFLLWTGLAVGVGSPFAYEYGTIRTQTVKIQEYKVNDNGASYTFKTDKGTFNLERSRLHFQSLEDVQDMWQPIYTGKTYDIKTYGWHLMGNWHPNIIDVKEVSQEELDKRAAELKKQKDNEKQNTNTTPANNNNGNNNATPAALSGQMVTVNVMVNGYNVQITIPVEAAGKVTINSVAPIVQTNNVQPPVNNNNTTPPPVSVTPPANNSNPPSP